MNLAFPSPRLSSDDPDTPKSSAREWSPRASSDDLETQQSSARKRPSLSLRHFADNFADECCDNSTTVDFDGRDEDVDPDEDVDLDDGQPSDGEISTIGAPRKARTPTTGQIGIARSWPLSTGHSSIAQGRRRYSLNDVFMDSGSVYGRASAHQAAWREEEANWAVDDEESDLRRRVEITRVALSLRQPLQLTQMAATSSMEDTVDSLARLLEAQNEKPMEKLMKRLGWMDGSNHEKLERHNEEWMRGEEQRDKDHKTLTHTVEEQNDELERLGWMEASYHKKHDETNEKLLGALETQNESPTEKMMEKLGMLEDSKRKELEVQNQLEQQASRLEYLGKEHHKRMHVCCPSKVSAGTTLNDKLEVFVAMIYDPRMRM